METIITVKQLRTSALTGKREDYDCYVEEHVTFCNYLHDFAILLSKLP